MLEYGYDEAGGWTGNLPHLSFRDIYASTIDFIRRNEGICPWYVYLGIHQSHLAHLPSKAAMTKMAHLDDWRDRVYAAVVWDRIKHEGGAEGEVQQVRPGLR